jgi:hypothetical protein
MLPVEHILDNYIRKEHTDFAILIDGKWGSGKSYFIANNFKEQLIEINKFYKGNEFSIAYISLYGLGSVDQLRERVFLAVNPKLAKQSISRKLVRAIVNQSAEYLGIGSIGKDIVNIFGGIPKNKILVFDDLERAESTIMNQLLGFINNYTEHQNLKVLILADEEKIPDSAQYQYKVIKEKFVRFTYSFQSNIETIFDNIIVRYNNRYKAFLQSHKELILSLFRAGNHTNLRTLNFILDIFLDIHKKTNEGDIEHSSNNDTILKSFLFFVVIYSIEYKKGLPDNADIGLQQLSKEIENGVHGELLKRMIVRADNSIETADDELNIFARQISEVYLPNHRIPFKYYNLLASYILSGKLIDEDFRKLLASEHNAIERKKGKPEYNAYKQIRDFDSLEDKDLEILVAQILEHVKLGRYQYSEQIDIFVRLSDLIKSDLITLDFYKLLELSLAGIEATAKKSEPEIFPTRQLFYHIRNIAGVDKLIAKIESVNELNKQKKYEEIIESAKSKLVSNDFDSLVKDIVEGTVNEPIFIAQIFPASRFLDIFINKPNASKTEILSILKRRLYKFDSYGKIIFEEEREFFEELVTLIDSDLTSTLTGRIDKYNLNALKRIAENAVKAKS